MRLIRYLALAILALPATGFAADFDGSKPLICATMSATDCARGDTCAVGLPEDIGAPSFMRLDFAKKAVVGPEHSSPILLQDKSDDQLLLQGRELGFGWTIAIEATRGEMAVTLTDRMGAYVIYGNCTPL